MSDIRFACPECDGSLVVDEAGAGMEVPCPHCGKPIRIPVPQPPALPEPLSAPRPDVAPEDAGAGHEKLHLKKNPVETWKEHKTDEPAEALLHKLGFDEPKIADEDPIAAAHHKGEERGIDVNVDQPWIKKKDQWFTSNGKKYHYCYYNPRAPIMATACGTEQMPVSADIAPDNLSRLRHGAFCKKCVRALELERLQASP